MSEWVTCGIFCSMCTRYIYIYIYSSQNIYVVWVSRSMAFVCPWYMLWYIARPARDSCVVLIRIWTSLWLKTCITGLPCRAEHLQTMLYHWAGDAMVTLQKFEIPIKAYVMECLNNLFHLHEYLHISHNILLFRSADDPMTFYWLCVYIIMLIRFITPARGGWSCITSWT